MQPRRKWFPALLVSFAIVLGGCKDDRGGAESDGEYAEPRAQITLASNLAASIPAATPLVRKPLPVSRSAQIKAVTSVSNDPDLVSGNDVLVEVLIANPIEAARDVVVTLNGADVTSKFDLRTKTRILGLVSGLEIGENRIIASSRTNPSSSAQLIVRNHPSSGPIFSGPHIQPWICAQPSPTTVTVVNPNNGDSAEAKARLSGLSSVPNAQCQILREVTYYYQPVSAAGGCNFDILGSNACFVPWDSSDPPADSEIARFTNDRGDVVRSILALERGALNRGMYSLAVFYDPERHHHPAQPQRGWNNKLLFEFAGGSAGDRFQSPARHPIFNQQALRAGYMLATSSLNDHGTNTNHVVGAETVMMLKEHIVERYGPIRFTIGSGEAGGAIVQLTMASSYPGLLNGLITAQTYADALTAGIEKFDCDMIASRGYFGYMSQIPPSEQGWVQLSVTGHSKLAHCSFPALSWLPSTNPTKASNCGAGFPTSLVYHSVDNPGGLRCSHAEHNVNVLGSFANSNGVIVADYPMDNLGVQYGLQALQGGLISMSQFMHLNEHLGGVFEGQVYNRTRSVATPDSLERAYRSGMVVDGRYLAHVPIIDMRYKETEVDTHLNWRAKSVRDRLVKTNGHHDNHVIWAYDQTRTSSPANAAFITMDLWLAAIEADQTYRSIAEKVVNAKPSSAADRCLVSNFDGTVRDLGLDSPSCPIKFGKSPRQVAGGPVAEDVLKCQLKPFDPNSSDYTWTVTGEPMTFTAYTEYQLSRIFSEGVCDWSKPGVGQQLNPGCLSYSDGPDGVPMDVGWFERAE